MPQLSAEMRWFLAGTSLAEVEAFGRWFRSGGLPPGGGKKERKDVYAVDPSSDELGVKDREGRSGLEVKVLVEPRFLSLELGSRAATVQLWSKVASKALTLPAGAQQLTTLKTRWLRKLDTAGAGAEEVALGGGPFGEEPTEGSLPGVGCNVEWTRIELPDSGATWWTFGFEAFAAAQSGPVWGLLEDALRKTLLALEAGWPGSPRLGPEWREQSYPAWIQSLSTSRWPDV